jgi:alpha-galactosidase
MSDPIVLSAAGVGLVLDVRGLGLPRVVHWGADPGPLSAAAAGALAGAASPAAAAVDGADPWGPLPLLPAQWDGWAGRNGATGSRSGRWQHLRLVSTSPATVADGVLTAEAADPVAGVAVRSWVSLTPQGVIVVRHALTNTGADEWSMSALRCLLPMPNRATELLDLTGRWGLERVPQRHAFTHGTHARESRRGRTGHDAATLLVAGVPGFSFGAGEVWSVHIGWSGDHEHYAERLAGAVGVLGGGELLAPGEVRLAPGETYTTPEAFFVWSGAGLDGLSERLHAMLRARPTHPRSPRPLTLNVWEAVYFDHDLDRLTALADQAARIGVERYVLDDGWFTGRRDDTAGLGDWEIDGSVWPDGLGPLVDRVRSHGMQFGLWFEPEMVNPDSDLARAHPDWFLAAPGRPARPERQQQVLDLTRPEVVDLLFERISALVAAYRIDYIKWDHNRDLLEAAPGGTAGVHRQTLAAYELMDRLRATHPGLEIESCASGGGRVDLGVLARTDRVWASDSNDPLDRQHIQRWTGLLLPPELVGSHVGPSPAHVNGRVSGVEFRCATALLGHAGIEWDITRCTPRELQLLADWIRLYTRTRAMLHTGRTVRVDLPDPSAYLYGVVAADRSAALFIYTQLDSALERDPVRVPLPALDRTRTYRVTRCWGSDPGLPADGVALPGAALSTVGLVITRPRPVEATVLELTAL